MNQTILNSRQEIANDQSNANYDVRNEVIYNAETLKSDLCDYNDTYILVKSDIKNKKWYNT